MMMQKHKTRSTHAHQATASASLSEQQTFPGAQEILAQASAYWQHRGTYFYAPSTLVDFPCQPGMARSWLVPFAPDEATLSLVVSHKPTPACWEVIPWCDLPIQEQRSFLTQYQASYQEPGSALPHWFAALEQAAKRQEERHPPELQQLLEQYGQVLGTDLSAFWVYGSASRPMQAVWARIADAVFMQVDHQATGYYTYVAVPAPLAPEIVTSYHLALISPMSTARLVRVTAVELACPECGSACFNPFNGSYLIEEHQQTVQCKGCGKTLKTPLAAFQQPHRGPSKRYVQ